MNWTRTKDAAPTTPGNYLIVIPATSPWGPRVTTCYWNGKEWAIDWQPISHWMELPKAPE